MEGQPSANPHGARTGVGQRNPKCRAAEAAPTVGAIAVRGPWKGGSKSPKRNGAASCTGAAAEIPRQEAATFDILQITTTGPRKAGVRRCSGHNGWMHFDFASIGVGVDERRQVFWRIWIASWRPAACERKSRHGVDPAEQNA